MKTHTASPSSYTCLTLRGAQPPWLGTVRWCTGSPGCSPWRPVCRSWALVLPCPKRRGRSWHTFPRSSDDSRSSLATLPLQTAFLGVSGGDKAAGVPVQRKSKPQAPWRAPWSLRGVMPHVSADLLCSCCFVLFVRNRSREFGDEGVMWTSGSLTSVRVYPSSWMW